MTTITIDTLVPSDPATAFAAWVDAERLRAWWWPMFPDTTYDLDPRVGGAYRIESAAAGIGVRGDYREVTESSRSRSAGSG